ncbi:Ldh family oxidoreductase [Oryzobacter sp. R7]|uniref:Ldh family oxidoreductase n=1 Tax=Oryzobacter faecalis TaxID=3388656 RepID=UPI00398CAE5C
MTVTSDTHGTRTVAPDALRTFATAVLQAHSVPEPDAALLADTLVVAELWGHASHGMLRLPWYLERLRSGATETVTEPEVVRDHGAVVVLDGRHGIGQVVTSRAVDLGVERARAHGVSAVGVRNSGHFGTAAYFTRRAAEAGCVAVLSTNASPAMAPWGGRTKAVGTNPWSIAAPAGRHGVVVMDLANTAVARGKVHLAAERGTGIPEGWAADEHGTPTTDADAAIHGLILPMAGPKGYVIAFMMDVLSGVLTGSAYGDGVAGPYTPEGRSGAGHLLLTVDVAAMAEPAEFAARMEDLVDRTRATPTADWADRVLVPGELEDATAARLATAGIPVADTTWDNLTRLSGETGVDLPTPLTKEPSA